MQAESTDVERTVDLGWITLGYDDVGVGDPPMILLHGAGAGATSRSNFVANIPALATAGRVLAVDLPGFGRSDPYVMTDEPRGTVSARAICGLMDSLGIEKANFVGNSLGGGVALTFAVDFPERVNRLVIMGSGGASVPLFTVRPTEGIKALQAAYRDPTLPKFRAFFDIMLYDGSKVSDEVLQQRIASVKQEYVDAWIESYKSPERTLAGELGKVVAPVLILHGRDDRIVPLEGGLSLLSSLPNSELHAFNHCGHWVQYEQARRSTRWLSSFLVRPSSR
jgi:2-hydroxy-6-oxonona-2,4-dienedioate hydrolase